MNGIVTFSLKQPVLVIVLLALLFAAGTAAYFNLNIEAYPDPVPPLVDINTQSAGMSAEEIERYITIPIEIQMAGIPHVTAIRTISLFGLSDVKLQFTYDFTYDEAQQWVINRLSGLSGLPNGVQPNISPWSPIGEIYRYRVVGPPGYSVLDLKTIQDWILERRFKAVPGVLDVTGWGGKTKIYEVTVDLRKLMDYGLNLQQLLQVLGNSNLNVGGQTLNIGSQSAVVRGVGLIHSMDDIRNTTLIATNGTPVLLRDVAAVTIGNKPRLGIAGQDNDDDIVQGTVLMRRGEQSMPTIGRVEAEVDRINASGILPPLVRIEKIYDRSDLIGVTTRTVLHNMMFGILLIFLVQWIFLGDLRSALIVAATIPFALFFAILIMTLRGESANLLSVGAVDFGLIVDATVILLENVFRHLGRSQVPPAREVDSGLSGKAAVIAAAANQVNRGIFFSASIIVAGFIPLFTMSGVEGHIFGPMARTYAYAILGGLIATFTVSPVLASLLLPETIREAETAAIRRLRLCYRPLIEFAHDNKVLTLGCAGFVIVLALGAINRLGSEFLPHLEEGNFWIRASMPPSISLEAGDDVVNRMRKLIKSYPEVETVISQHGRPDDGTDATGFFNAEFFAPLKPTAEWPSGITKEQLTNEILRRLEASFPGVDFNFSQYLEDNVAEAASGVKGENSVKLFGNDLGKLQETAERIRRVLATVSGVTDLAVFSSLGQPTVRIDIDRPRAGRYGLAIGDIDATIQAAIGGQSAGNLYEEGSDRNFPIIVRLASEYRQSLDAIRHIAVGAPNPNGNGIVQIPMADVADIRLDSGASFIYRENQERYIPIKFNVRGRDLGSAVLEAQEKIASVVQLPPGYHLEWVGEFGEFQEAMARLAVIVPLSVLLIATLLYLNFGSLTDALLAGSVIPMALVGGIFALYLTGTAFSVSAAIGFVALFGIAAMDGIIVVSYFNRMIDEEPDEYAALLRTCEIQMRPVLMTCVVACVGLLPAALSTGIGSQVQKPLALVVVGGSILAPAFILIILPLLISMFSRRHVVVAESIQARSGTPQVQ
jgi:cobalt-zinc-cadmium resistance protein CzcA